MLAVQGHTMIALALTHRVLCDFFVSCGIDFSDYVLVLKVYINAPGDRIITWIAGLALKVNGRNDLIFGYVHHRLSFGTLIRNVDFVKWRRVCDPVRLGFGWKLLDELHLPEV